MDFVLGTENYVLAKKLLDVNLLRHEAIASNLANVETPGYKRIDVSESFENVLKRRVGHGDIEGIQALRPRLAVDPNGGAERADGNNIQIDKELIAVNKNAAEHEYLTQLISGNIKQLKMAISGRTTA